MFCLYEYGSVLSEAGGVRLRLHVRELLIRANVVTVSLW